MKQKLSQPSIAHRNKHGVKRGGLPSDFEDQVVTLHNIGIVTTDIARALRIGVGPVEKAMIKHRRKA